MIDKIGRFYRPTYEHVLFSTVKNGQLVKYRSTDFVYVMMVIVYNGI